MKFKKRLRQTEILGQKETTLKGVCEASILIRLEEEEEEIPADTSIEIIRAITESSGTATHHGYGRISITSMRTSVAIYIGVTISTQPDRSTLGLASCSF